MTENGTRGNMLKIHIIKFKAYFVLLVGGFFIFLFLGILIFKHQFNPFSVFENFTQNYFKYYYFSKTAKSFSEDRDSDLKAESVPVLLYHGIGERKDSLPLEFFEDQMLLLKKLGYKTISLGDFYKFMKGEKNLPRKSFLLTFDDGRKDSFYPADPVLKALDYRAVMFIISKNSLVEKSNFYLSKNELHKMLETKRWEIAAHTKNGHEPHPIDENGNSGHFYSNKLYLAKEKRLESEQEFEARIFKDFLETKIELEKEFKNKIFAFAYPYGDFGQSSVNFPQAQGIIFKNIKLFFPLSFYQVWPGKGFSFNYQDKNAFIVKRINVGRDWNSHKLLEVLMAGENKSLPFFDDFTIEKGWIQSWGKAVRNGKRMEIMSDAKTSGASIFLDGSGWENYIVISQMTLIKGNTFSILSRYSDSENYLSCDYNKNSIAIREKFKGQEKILAKWENSDFQYLAGKKLEAGMAMDKNSIQCLLNKKIVVESSNSFIAAKKGGIGFRVWDPKPGNAQLNLYEVKVLTKE